MTLEPGNVELVIDDTKTTAELMAALAKAQSEMETVGKDRKNTQSNYNYATADNMIRGSRGPLTKNGLSFVVTWSQEPVDAQPGDIGNQFVGAVVTGHWRLFHASGGILRGTAVMDAICSRARPTDKAVAATLTYMHGFILRGLLNMDRAEESGDDVDRREESDFAGRRPQQHQQRRQPPQSKDQRKEAANRATGGALTPASEIKRGDDGNWEQWLKVPAEVEAALEAGEVKPYFCQALKGLLRHCGVTTVGHARTLLSFCMGDNVQDIKGIEADPGLSHVAWQKLIDKHNSTGLPFTRLLGEAMKAQNTTDAPAST